MSETIDLDILGGTGIVAAPLSTASPAPESGDRDLVNQLLGQAQLASAFSGFCRTISASKLAFVKANRLYKGLAGKMAPNGSAFKGTWEEFCGLLGISKDKADLDIQNLQAFGESALERMSSMGIGYRELRQYRRLPDDERDALVEVAEAGDKETFLELAESIISKHAREKAALTEELAAAERRGNNLDAQIEVRERELKHLRSKARLTAFEPRTEAIRAECLALQGEIELPLASLVKLLREELADVSTRAEPSGEANMRLDAAYLALAVAGARINGALAAAQEEARQRGIPLPDHITGQNVLTPEEGERWLRDYATLQNTHEAKKLLRQEARAADLPRGRGRPKGKNKPDVKAES
ncbi:MAG: hypothetical protein LBJ59_08730 [Zoogloeaceae bacterium]|jgi:hypothetical protein|nr:hypothetical protein [Zoogloeaceae bacterium]